MSFSNLPNYIWLALGIAFVGFLDDVKSLRPLVKLILVLAISGVAFALHPQLMPQKLIDVFVYMSPTALWVLSTLFTTGFVNAGNIADGANGLLSIVASTVFLFAFLTTGSPAYWIFFVSVIVFALYNYIQVQFFSVTRGPHLLSSVMVLICFYLYDNFDISLWFFACICSYPCLEILCSLLQRFINKRSLTVADNSHTHNHVYKFLLSKGLQPLSANSATGVVVAFFSSIMPTGLLVLTEISAASDVWIMVFLLQVILFVVVRYVLHGQYD